MLKEYLKRNDVLKIIKEIKTNDKYFNKSTNNLSNSFICVSNEVALFIFYDALYKYKIIIDDNNLLEEYLNQVDKLYKKLDNFEDVKYGINRTICKMLINKFDIKNINDDFYREMIISRIYDTYIEEGYFIHGFHPSYIEDIKKDGFRPEEYKNYYDRFSKVNSIFEKYNQPRIIDKDFLNKNVYFTDDFIMGCYYSMYAPLFFYNFLFNDISFGKRIRKDNCLISDYSSLTRHLKRFMNINFFSEEDKKYILDLVEDEWKLLNNSKNFISLILVKRNKIFNKEIRVSEYLKDKKDIYEIVDRMLSSKYTNLEYGKYLSNDDIEIIKLDNYSEEEKVEKKVKLKNDLPDINNKYGSVSILLLLGCLFISLGVIISIFSVLGG